MCLGQQFYIYKAEFIGFLNKCSYYASLSLKHILTTDVPECIVAVETLTRQCLAVLNLPEDNKFYLLSIPTMLLPEEHSGKICIQTASVNVSSKCKQQCFVQPC